MPDDKPVTDAEILSIAAYFRPDDTMARVCADLRAARAALRTLVEWKPDKTLWRMSHADFEIFDDLVEQARALIPKKPKS